MENLYSSKDLLIISAGKDSLCRKNQKHAQNNHISLVAVLSRCFKMATSTRRYQWSQKWSTYTGWTVDRICYKLVLSGYIDDQRILKFDSLSVFGVITREYVFYQTRSLHFFSGCYQVKNKDKVF